MIALRSHDVVVTRDPRGEIYTAWEAEMRVRCEELMTDRRLAVDLLVSPDDKLRELAILSFHYRWPIDDEVFQRLRPIAGADPRLENRAAAIALFSSINLRCDRSDRPASRAALAEAARWPGQHPEIAEFAELHYRSTEEPSAEVVRSMDLHSADWELARAIPLS